AEQRQDLVLNLGDRLRGVLLAAAELAVEELSVDREDAARLREDDPEGGHDLETRRFGLEAVDDAAGCLDDALPLPPGRAVVRDLLWRGAYLRTLLSAVGDLLVDRDPVLGDRLLARGPPGKQRANAEIRQRPGDESDHRVHKDGSRQQHTEAR